LGQTNPSRPLQGFRTSLRLFRGTSPCPRTTLAGLNCLSERSGLRSGDIGSPRPPRRLNDLEVFRRPTCRAVVRPSDDSHRLRRPLRVRAETPSPVQHGPDRPSWGFPPLQRHRRRDPYVPGLPRPAPSVLGVFRPLDGLLSLRPCGLAGSAAAHGVPARDALSNGKAVVHRCTRCVLSPTVLRSLEL